MSNVNSWMKDSSGTYDNQSQPYLQNVNMQAANIQVGSLDPSLAGYMNRGQGKTDLVLILL